MGLKLGLSLGLRLGLEQLEAALGAQEVAEHRSE